MTTSDKERYLERHLGAMIAFALQVSEVLKQHTVSPETISTADDLLKMARQHASEARRYAEGLAEEDEPQRKPATTQLVDYLRAHPDSETGTLALVLFGANVTNTRGRIHSMLYALKKQGRVQRGLGRGKWRASQGERR